ncbi:hypothetical protein GYH30_033319 [Glycine max]|nr:hypothetical protein GYH30_033319 [Glycine max]
MVRIGGGEYRVDKGAAPKMLNCLMSVGYCCYIPLRIHVG